MVMPKNIYLCKGIDYARERMIAARVVYVKHNRKIQ